MIIIAESNKHQELFNFKDKRSFIPIKWIFIEIFIFKNIHGKLFSAILHDHPIWTFFTVPNLNLFACVDLFFIIKVQLTQKVASLSIQNRSITREFQKNAE